MRFPKIITVPELALSVVIGVSSGAGASPPESNARLDESVNCFAVTSLLSASEDPQAKQAGLMGAIYFMGRLEGQISDKELEDRMFAFSRTTTTEETSKLLVHCGELMKVHGAAIEAIGARVTAREEAAKLAKPAS